MKQFILALTGMCTSLFGFSQSRIDGTVLEKGKPIESASVFLLNTDSSSVKSVVTQADGTFIFQNVNVGKYLVRISSVGFQTMFTGPIDVTGNSNLSLGVNELSPVEKQMKEVVVTSKRPFIERKADRIILNVEASISNTGTTALEMLEKAPGVTVDKDGNVSLNGKQGVMMMIDGKSTYMTGTDLTNYLKSLPSSNLDQIEIMANPSAKYDAAGTAGIINLKTKKIKQKGFNGSLSLSYGQGFYPKTMNSLNLNYRVNKINLFATASDNYRETYQDLDIFRAYKNNDGSLKAIFDQQSTADKVRQNYNAKLGMDYFISRKTTLGFVFTGYTTPGSEDGYNISYLKNPGGITDSIVTAERSEDATWKNVGANINFRHIFDSTGKELTADLDYLEYNANKDQLFTNSSYDKNSVFKFSDQLKGDLPSTIKIYSGKLDYTQSINKVKFETGIKSSYVSTDNAAAYFNIVNGQESVDYEKTNHFRYHENINAGYINFSRDWAKWSVQAGLRAENTNYDGNQFGNLTRFDSSFKHTYTSLFPTAFLSYTVNKNNQLSLSFGRRINRPDYEDLNPFLFFLDKYTYGSGNPFLRPMYSYVYELSHTFKQVLTTTVNYGHTIDLFNDVFEERGFTTVQTQGNYGIFNNAGISLSAQLPVTKAWKSIIYTEGRYQEYKGLLYGRMLDVNAWNVLFNVNNQFQFKKGWSAELSGFVRSKALEGQLKINPIGQLNAGVQKLVLKDKGSIKFTVRDILRTMYPSGDLSFQNTDASFEQHTDTRIASLSFNYRFGKPIKGIQKRKTGGAGDEQNRIKSAN